MPIKGEKAHASLMPGCASGRQRGTAIRAGCLASARRFSKKSGKAAGLFAYPDRDRDDSADAEASVASAADTQASMNMVYF